MDITRAYHIPAHVVDWALHLLAAGSTHVARFIKDDTVRQRAVDSTDDGSKGIPQETLHTGGGGWKIADCFEIDPTLFPNGSDV